jgi:hypothetical protein
MAVANVPHWAAMRDSGRRAPTNLTPVLGRTTVSLSAEPVRHPIPRGS